MNLAIRIAAAILSVPPDVLAPMVPMMAPPPRNTLEFEVRNEVDSVLSGPCCRSSEDSAPLFLISKEEESFVNCNSGLPSNADNTLFDLSDHNPDEIPQPSTYGEITSLGARQLFHHMGLTTSTKPSYQFYDLGSGGGRLVIQSHLELPSVVKSVGIELSPSRHKVALQTWERIVKDGDAGRIRKLAEQSWGMKVNDIIPGIELHEGDLFELDISRASHMYLSSLCFSDEMLEKLVDKIEVEGVSLQTVASLRMLPQNNKVNNNKRRRKLGSEPWMEFLEMSWNKARGDGCPVYFYSVKNAREEPT